MSAFGQQAGAADDATQQQQAADTSTAETGAQQTAQPNWEDRYKDAQSWGTRLAQEKAELEAEAQIARALRSENPDERLQALQALGLSLVEDEQETGGQVYDEPDPRLLQRLEQLEQHVTHTTQQQESEQNYAAYRQLTDPQLQQMGVPEGLRDVIAEAALGLPAIHTPQGPVPDLQGAWEQFGGMAEHFAAIPAVQTAVQKAWARSKPRTALTSPNGAAGTQRVELDTRAKRADFITQALMEAEADERAGA